MSFFSFLTPLLLASHLFQGPGQGTQATAANDATPGTFTWSANRPLTWADFKSKPTPSDRLAALTSANIDVQAACQDFKFASTVRAIFIPTESWVRDPSKATPNLLRHEQLHFDITELYARKLRQKISLAKFDCEHLQPRFKNMSNAVFAEWQREEARYDQETNHGLTTDRQRGWEVNIQNQLNQLAQFAVK
ncbi:DUF922 domain-containing protein [Hymenobacter cavernae]|uniref:DUF922 domain-containing protein n=1 Tax=Hymenobacter cavernae TaxID=2044852 RepID=A0ABQ1UQJ4_9BACT|nr:DUF922 domain-containing protein [Hymenobacter cavernae]GGF23767.1 hypothetical protein GCM10011383_39270 [Hymenobacter cavernae]